MYGHFHTVQYTLPTVRSCSLFLESAADKIHSTLNPAKRRSHLRSRLELLFKNRQHIVLQSMLKDQQLNQRESLMYQDFVAVTGYTLYQETRQETRRDRNPAVSGNPISGFRGRDSVHAALWLIFSMLRKKNVLQQSHFSSYCLPKHTDTPASLTHDVVAQRSKSATKKQISQSHVDWCLFVTKAAAAGLPTSSHSSNPSHSASQSFAPTTS